MKNVIVPVDFSETSAVATRFGVHLAELLGYGVHIVHICDLVLSGAHSLTTPEQQRDEKRLKRQLAAFTAEHLELVLAANHGRTPHAPEVISSLRSGMATNQILRLSRKEDTAFIVMGGVGAGAGADSPELYGSIATPVAMRGSCPVILIPKDYGTVTIEKLAIAFDDADEIIRIGEFTRSIIEVLKPEVRYIHVSKAGWREELDNQDDFLDLTCGKGAPSYGYKSDLLPPGDVVKQLSGYVVEESIDLLVLGGKRQGFWSRLFDKNHLRPIIQVVKAPMMVIPFQAESEHSSSLGRELAKNIY